MGKKTLQGKRDVLVAIMNNRRDFEIARDEHWYRIPRTSVDKWLSKCWPPRWLALYQTKAFGEEAHAVNYFAPVSGISNVKRVKLFPDQPNHSNAEKLYAKLSLGPLERLAEPIFSRRFRRIVFIPTTWDKFSGAYEINDLYDESPLEDRVWAAFKRLNIQAERQEFFELDSQFVALDFAIYCEKGKINVETDGDTWHANPQKAAEDNRRDNALVVNGWSILRFGTSQIVESLDNYCIPKIVSTVNSLGGLQSESGNPSLIQLRNCGDSQPGLFDGLK